MIIFIDISAPEFKLNVSKSEYPEEQGAQIIIKHQHWAYIAFGEAFISVLHK